MIKYDEELHVSLRDPIRIKLQDRSVTIVAFDGVMVSGVDGNWAPDPSTCMVTFAADAVYRRRLESVGSKSSHDERQTTYEVVEAVKFRGKIYVPPSNIASIVPQPFRKS